MEFRTSENPDCIVYDSIREAYYWSTIDAINKIHREINDKLASDEQFSIKEIYDILTEDWPEDKKEEFWERFYFCVNWMIEINGDRHYCFLQRKSLNKNGDTIIHLDFEIDWTKNEEPE